MKCIQRLQWTAYFMRLSRIFRVYHGFGKTVAFGKMTNTPAYRLVILLLDRRIQGPQSVIHRWPYRRSVSNYCPLHCDLVPLLWGELKGCYAYFSTCLNLAYLFRQASNETWRQEHKGQCLAYQINVAACVRKSKLNWEIDMVYLHNFQDFPSHHSF